MGLHHCTLPLFPRRRVIEQPFSSVDHHHWFMCDIRLHVKHLPVWISTVVFVLLTLKLKLFLLCHWVSVHTWKKCKNRRVFGTRRKCLREGERSGCGSYDGRLFLQKWRSDLTDIVVWTLEDCSCPWPVKLAQMWPFEALNVKTGSLLLCRTVRWCVTLTEQRHCWYLLWLYWLISFSLVDNTLPATRAALSLGFST